MTAPFNLKHPEELRYRSTEVAMTRTIVVSFFLLCVSLATPAQGRAQGRTQPACTRTDLQSAVDAYLAAQRSGTPSSLPLAAPAKYTENTVETPFDKGILKS